MSTIKKIILPLLAVMFVLTSCDWNETKNLDFTQNHLSPEEVDPEGYAEYLHALLEYRESEHNVMVAGFDVIPGVPVKQSQHVSSLPDSVDYVWLKNIRTIDPVLLAEIKSARERKGMEFLADVNLDVITADWTRMESDKIEAGGTASSETEFIKYVKDQTAAQLEKCTEYELDGIVFTANGLSNPVQEAFIKSIKDWHAGNGYKTFIFRGALKNIKDSNVFKFCDYLIVIGDENSTTATDLNQRVSNILGIDPAFPTNNILVEVVVPDSVSPEQKGATSSVAAEWVLKYKKSRSYTPQGIVVSNAEDDYYRSELIYHNVRRAISIMNNPEE